LATLNIIETSNSSGNFENFNTMNGVRHYQTYNIGWKANNVRNDTMEKCFGGTAAASRK